MATEQIIWLLPLPPLLAFVLIVLFTNKSNKLSHIIGVGAAALSWLGAMVVFFRAVTDHHFVAFTDKTEWLPLGDGWLEVGVHIDGLSAAVLFFVGITIFMIFLYSVGYHNFGQPEGDHDKKGFPPHGATVEEHGHKHVVPSVEPMYARFFAFIGLFAAGMYTLVISDNLLTLFVGWEIMGLCSYLLIGFWFQKKSARNAGIKAFMTTRIGDVFMLLGLAWLYTEAGSLRYAVIFEHHFIEELAHTSAFWGLSVAGAIGLLLFIGAVGKSAQWPLHVWLPDAMEGPTPVSAMIHAATMVSAGVYMTIRIFPLFSAGWDGHGLTTAMSVIAFIGTFTAIFAATIAIAQNDVKGVLAYSTISQLGFMVAAIGIGAYVAAAFHLVTHAFFKALLFLGSGSVIHGMEHGVLHTGDHSVDPQDMRNMGGLYKKMPITFWTFLIGGAALSGFPLVTAGFWSKDEIFADAFAHGHYWVLGTLALAAFLTAFYTMRQITMTFLGEARTPEAEHAHETPWTMTTPLVVLAIFAVGYGWLGIPEDFMGIQMPFKNWFHGFVGHTVHLPTHGIEFVWMPLLISLVVALGGMALGYFMYKSFNKVDAVDPMRKILGPVYHFIENKYYFDEAYDVLFVKPAYWISSVFTEKMDRGVIDGILHGFGKVSYFIGTNLRDWVDTRVLNEIIGDGLADRTQDIGELLRKIQTGRVQQYLISALGVLFVIFIALYYLVLAG